MKRIGITHPIPTQYAKRIYDENKNVFVSKRHLRKVSKGDIFVIYESHGEMAFTGWAKIKFTGLLPKNNIIRDFHERLFITKKEFEIYSKGKSVMNVIEFEDFEKFNKPYKSKKFVPVAGRYIDENEYKAIKKNKD